MVWCGTFSYCNTISCMAFTPHGVQLRASNLTSCIVGSRHVLTAKYGRVVLVPLQALPTH